MILKRKIISRKYKIEFTRLKENATNSWCKLCNYFEVFKDDGRNKCTSKFVKDPTITIYNICMKLIPVDIGNKLKNYIYVVLKRKED